jgi:phytanoyl-CoA hydroxylase
MPLTQREEHQFDELGYVVKPGVFDTDAVLSLQTGLTEAVTVVGEQLVAAGRLSSTYEELGFERQLAAMFEEDIDAGKEAHGAVTGAGGGAFKEQAMLDFLRHPPLIDCITQLVGPEIIGSSVYRVRPKVPAYDRGEVPWHQDGGYLLAHCDQDLMVTCWIPLVDATQENGCLYVLPGQHREGIFKHYTGGHAGYLEIAPEDLPTPQPVCCPMKAGDVLFMTNRTPHASFANTTDVVRWSIDLRYHDFSVPNNVDEPPEAYTPEREPVTMACHPSEADFVIRYPEDPSREVTRVEEFQEIRARYEKIRPKSPGRGWTPLKERKQV